ncbi:hypothetical protein LINGRAHAP2_LOCUS18906, partial [Linum grandiflorum]
EVTFKHIYREANSAADYLANLGHSFAFGFHIVDLPDRGLSQWFRYNVIGVSLSRSFSVLNKYINALRRRILPKKILGCPLIKKTHYIHFFLYKRIIFGFLLGLFTNRIKLNRILSNLKLAG